MKKDKFIKRVGEILKKELEVPEHWMYVSFADKKFNGGIIIKAHGITDALTKINWLGINPGGQVMTLPIPDEYLPAVEYHNRLLTEKDIKEFWPDAMSIREIEDKS